MQHLPQTINIERIKSLSPFIEEMSIGNDVIMGELSGEWVEKSEAILRMLQYPVRFDGFILFYLKKGHFTLDVNLKSYEVRENSLMIHIPGNIVKLSSYDGEHIGDTDMIFVFISKDFMSGIRFDFQKVFQDDMHILEDPLITLDEFQRSLANDYFNLAQKIISTPFSNKREILGSLLTSLTYMSSDVWDRQKDEALRTSGAGRSGRKNLLFDQFIALVNKWHNSQRRVAFYADKLCLTPKYLSALIKEVSGKSAAEWIDDFVLLEAKDLLRYTTLDIKEISAQLNFPSQPVFFKFFTTRAGMTPSQYRKS